MKNPVVIRIGNPNQLIANKDIKQVFFKFKEHYGYESAIKVRKFEVTFEKNR